MSYFYRFLFPVLPSLLLALFSSSQSSFKVSGNFEISTPPVLPPSSFASFARKSPARLDEQHSTGDAAWHNHGFLRTEWKNILSEHLFSISFESWKGILEDYTQIKQTLSPFFHLDAMKIYQQRLCLETCCIAFTPVCEKPGHPPLKIKLVSISCSFLPF